MASQLSWFLTPVGRKFSFGFMATASISVFGVQYCPQTFFLYKLKDMVSMYQSTEPVPLSDRLLKLWNHTLEDLSLPEHEAKYLEPFTVFGFELFHAGSTSGRFGAIIGLPINFTYKDVVSVDRTPILVNHQPVNWNREDAKQLLESLILSEDAQRYGIAREILMTRYNTPLISSALGSLMVSSTYILCRSMNSRFHLLERPLAVRGIFYLLGCLFSFGIWATQTDIFNVYWEKETDTYLAHLDDRYTKGAVEFYSKILKRNIALRSLIGVQGESAYTPTGNEKFLFRQPRLPIDKRKEFFENIIASPRKENMLFDKDEVIHQTAQI